MLKVGASRKMTKSEKIERRIQQDTMNRNSALLQQVGNFLQEKKLNASEIPQLISEHEKMLEFMKSKDLINSFNSNVNIQP